MKIGLFLSGVVCEGWLILAYSKHLKKKNEITHLSGTSAGAIVGVLYAAGHSWETILTF